MTYIYRAFVSPGKRVDYLGEAVKLGPFDKDEDWTVLHAPEGVKLEDYDVGVTELLKAVAMMPIKELGLDPDKVNIHGGACAQGHPVGSTGSRLLVTLMHALKRYGKKKGVAALCIGGGEATAMAIEML